jgi:hypothetical protein
MPWQAQLKLKDGRLRTDFKGGTGPTPKVGQTIDYSVDGKTLKARVVEVTVTPTFDIVSVEEV